MKKVLYLHGLESKQGGNKVEYLAKTAAVFAPEMDYSNPQLTIFLEMMYQQLKPDVVIGSSMGGYAAAYLASKYPVDAILLNPALHSRSFEPNLNFELNLAGEDRQVVLCVGYTDEVIDPFETLKLMVDFPNVKIVRKPHAHRTPLEVFVDIYDKYQYNEL
jgi:pimeloyl-ACP methyl ester carboxylesterase